MTLSDCSHLANVIVIWPIQKLICFIVLLCISKYKPPGVYIRRGDLREGFLRYEFGGFIFGGAYTWSGLFSEFYGNYHLITSQTEPNRYYVSFMQTGFCPPAFITLGDSLSPDKPETRAKYETVFLCLNN